ncbi:MAG: DsbA family protein [Alphaproteobacteria bacterium]
MTDKNKKVFLVIAFVVVLSIVGGLSLLNGSGMDTTPAPDANGPGTTAATTTQEPVEHAAVIDSDDALEERALGEKNATVKIEEYASLTCSHCAHFYNEIFPKLKSKYIDSGKVRFVFSDFPLNAPAMHAAMIARCIPEAQYFDFIDTLFAEQEKWGFDPNYLAYLKATAAKHGVNGATYQTCLQNTEIQQGIVKRMEAAQAQWQINSTPTFVINNKKTINGTVSFEEFSKTIEEALGNPVKETEEAVPVMVTPEAATTTTTTTSPVTPSAAEKTIAVGEPNPATPADAEEAAPATEDETSTEETKAPAPSEEEAPAENPADEESVAP